MASGLGSGDGEEEAVGDPGDEPPETVLVRTLLGRPTLELELELEGRC